MGDLNGIGQWVLQNLLTVLASAGSLVATGAVIYSLVVLRNQLRLQVFLEYTRRFDEIKFPDGSFTARWVDLDPKRARKSQRAFRKYFDLCSQEWWLHHTGKIENRVWDVWARGMADIVNTPGGRYAWTVIQPEYQNVFPGFALFIDKLLWQGEQK
jgi:hypothetical protein